MRDNTEKKGSLSRARANESSEKIGQERQTWGVFQWHWVEVFSYDEAERVRCSTFARASQNQPNDNSASIRTNTLNSGTTNSLSR